MPPYQRFIVRCASCPTCTNQRFIRPMFLENFTYERRIAGLACHHHFLVKPHIFSCLGTSIEPAFSAIASIGTILPIWRMFVLSQIDGCSFLIHPLRRLLPVAANSGASTGRFPPSCVRQDSDWGWNRSLARIPLIASLSGRREAPAVQAEVQNVG